MREHPVCTVALRRFGVWRAAVAIVAAAAIGAVATWALQTIPGETPARAGLVLAMAVVLVVVSGRLALSLLRVEGGVLSGIGSRWTFLPDAAAGGEPETCDVAVAIDLGAFLLLTLTSVATVRPRRRWLPAQRRGLERDWHAFRCALYSPTDASSTPASPASLLSE